MNTGPFLYLKDLIIRFCVFDRLERLYRAGTDLFVMVQWSDQQLIRLANLF